MYAGDNPITFSDPNGEFLIEAAALTVAVYVVDQTAGRRFEFLAEYLNEMTGLGAGTISPEEHSKWAYKQAGGLFLDKLGVPFGDVIVELPECLSGSGCEGVVDATKGYIIPGIHTVRGFQHLVGTGKNVVKGITDSVSQFSKPFRQSSGQSSGQQSQMKNNSVNGPSSAGSIRDRTADSGSRAQNVTGASSTQPTGSTRDGA